MWKWTKHILAVNHETNKKDDDDNNNSGFKTKKTPVVGMVERGGDVKAVAVDKQLNEDLDKTMENGFDIEIPYKH